MGAKIFNVYSKLCGGDEKHKPVQGKQRRCVCMLMYLWTVKRFLLRSKVLMSQKSIFGVLAFLRRLSSPIDTAAKHAFFRARIARKVKKQVQTIIEKSRLLKPIK